MQNVVNELCTLVNVCWILVKILYPDVDAVDIMTVRCGFWSSLIPLHDKIAHQGKFATVSTVLFHALDHGFSNDWSQLLKRMARQVAHTSLME